MENEAIKYCKKCFTTKPTSQFNKCKNNKDGLTYYCKNCYSIAGAQYRQRQKDTLNYWKECAKKISAV